MYVTSVQLEARTEGHNESHDVDDVVVVVELEAGCLSAQRQAMESSGMLTALRQDLRFET